MRKYLCPKIYDEDYNEIPEKHMHEISKFWRILYQCREKYNTRNIEVYITKKFYNVYIYTSICAVSLLPKKIEHVAKIVIQFNNKAIF